MRFFLVDKVTELKKGEYARGVKAVTLTDPILHDHFPDYPIFPGVLIIEGLAQLSGYLLEMTFGENNDNTGSGDLRSVLCQVDKMKFYQTTGPGELLHYEAKIDSVIDRKGARVSVTAKANGELRAQGKISFLMVEINFPETTKQRKQLYQLWSRGMQRDQSQGQHHDKTQSLH